jgi:hypothetical protein
MKLDKEKIGVIFILIISAISVSLVFLHDPIAQDQNYHLFHDQRMFFGIPNFFNVTSNLLFLFAGIWGIQWITKSTDEKFKQKIKLSYFTLFLGVSLVAIGSGYYHLWPSDETLIWDRLPMTIAFMALFSIIIGEFISIRVGQSLLFPLLIFGFISVVYWYYTEKQGNGDLRLYVLVQFLPMLLIPIILLFFKPSFNLYSGYWLLLSAYLLAKVLEKFDSDVFNVLPLLSGHSLKHIVAACGVLLLMKTYKHRVLT